MGLVGNIVINLYSMAILLVLYMQTRKKTGRNTLQDKLFHWILQITALMLLMDTLGRFDGRPDTIYPLLNHTGNFLVFLFNPILPAMWLMYVHAQANQENKKTKRLLLPCGILCGIHALLLIASQYTGWFYFIDASNVYHRGPLYLLSVSFMVVFLLSAVAVIVRNRRNMEKKRYRSLLFFAVPPFLAAVLHSLVYGISIVLSGVVLSVLIVFLNIQNRNLLTDYLTGVYNRKGFDMHLKEKIRLSAAGRAFSAILLDFDHFKSINDTFGHDMGDKALQKSAELLRGCIRSADFIARFGGDEFVLLLDTADRKELESVVQRINSAIEKFNRDGGHSYAIGFSVGYAVYDAARQPTAEDFVKLLDQMMYQMKHG